VAPASGADDGAAVDRVAQGDIDVLLHADIAHRGEACFERAPGMDVRRHRCVDG